MVLKADVFFWTSKTCTILSPVEERAAMLRATLGGPTPDGKISAAHSLACTGAHLRLWDVAALRHAMRDASEDVRDAAVRSLGIIARGLIPNRLRASIAQALDAADQDISPRVRATAERARAGARKRLHPKAFD